MAPGDATLPSDQREILKQILSTVQSVQAEYHNLSTAVASVQRQVSILSEIKRVHDTTGSYPSQTSVASTQPSSTGNQWVASDPEHNPNVQVSSVDMRAAGHSEARSDGESLYGRKYSATATSRIILTTYPGQSGIDPLVMNWGHPDALKRGPVVVSRNQSTVRRRNAIGAHGGSYSIYHALAVASKHLDADHKPDFTNSEPAVNIGPFPQWTRIVSIDPLGHLSPWLFSDMIRDEDIHIRPSIAITKAVCITSPMIPFHYQNLSLETLLVSFQPRDMSHGSMNVIRQTMLRLVIQHMRLPELEQSVRDGRIVPDKKICLNEFGELAVTKFAVEPVWHLPGVAERFGIEEGALRRSLFENTGGSFPELITRGDIKLFLPPIGGLTVYCFGDPARMADPNVKLALRVHDECNGSDVFGSDICTCRPYLIFGVEEAVKEAQKGGSGVVIYFRKEGRALGEVTKYLVYNARKRGADRASEYFQRTENIAGVKDMRFQALMPDILHWLGITKIDRMLSMSNMKYDAIVEQGIPIHERVPIPDELIPEDSRVEIDAKLYAGYFTTGEVPSIEALSQVHGRAWDDVDH